MALIQVMTAIITLVPGTMDMITGWLSQIAEVPTNATVAQQQEWGRLPEDMSMYDGVIAVADCDRIGHEAWLRISYDGVYESDWLRTIVHDCSGHQSTTSWMARDNIIAEVGHGLALEHGFLDRGGVRGELIWIEEN